MFLILEILLVVTLVIATDSDGDGYDDYEDNCPYDYNPSQQNSDSDSFGDACDNCPTTYNPAQENNDFFVFEDNFDDGNYDGWTTDGDWNVVNGELVSSEDYNHIYRADYPLHEKFSMQALMSDTPAENPWDVARLEIFDPSADWWNWGPGHPPAVWTLWLFYEDTTGYLQLQAGYWNGTEMTWPTIIGTSLETGIDPRTLRLESDGNHYKGYVNDTLYIDFEDTFGYRSLMSMQYPALYTNNVSCSFDDFMLNLSDAFGDACDNCPYVYNPDQNDSELTKDLVSYWRFDEGNGTIAQDSFKDNDATIYGANYTEGRYETALSFSGSNNYVQNASFDNDIFVGTNEVTVSAWAYAKGIPDNGEGGDGWIITAGEGWDDNITYNLVCGDNSCKFRTRTNAVDCQAFDNDTVMFLSDYIMDSWYHLVGVFNGSYAKLYVNGELASEVLCSINLSSDEDGIIIGARASNNEEFNGTIDEVAIYHRTLTDEEIDYIYNDISGRQLLGGDGIGDVCDNCWYVINPDQYDSNMNCPSMPYTIDPKCGDSCEEINNPPVADPNGPYIVEIGEGAILDGSASYDADPGDYIEFYEWDLNDDGFYEVSETEPTLPLSWSDIQSDICQGTCDIGIPYTIALRVIDSYDEPSPEEYTNITIEGTVIQCGDIITENTILTGDLIDCPDNGLVIGANYITLDCDGHLIDGTGSSLYGVDLTGISGAVIANCNIQDFGIGIYLDGSDENLITNNSFNNNNYVGAWLQFSHFNIIWNNYFTNSLESNAWEDIQNSNNFWDNGETGNFWDDFPDNPGYPAYYEIPCVDPPCGIDNNPIWDSDGDGYDDYEDNCPYDYNPSQQNSDSDSFGDACDNCWYVDNPAQLDSDTDCPTTPYTTDPECGDACDEFFCADSDGDGYGVCPDCDISNGCVYDGDDCDDTNSSIYPGATEICNNVDDDCNATTIDGSGESPPLNTKQDSLCAGSLQSCINGSWTDDYSGLGSYQEYETLCDSIDNDCDLYLDIGCPMALVNGWNLISPTFEPTHQDANKNISLKKGWNMFGHSSDKLFTWLDALVYNGTETKTVEDAASAGWLQSTIYYYNGTIYKFIPGDDDYLRKNRGYWLYAFVDNLTLILPNAGGSLTANFFYWLNAELDDGIVTKTIEEAQLAGWLQGTIYYFDEDDQYYKFIPGDDEKIYPRRGYWLWSNQKLSLNVGFSEKEAVNKGEWDVIGTESYINKRIILNGNLNIKSGAQLNFDYVDLELNSSENDTLEIMVESGGSFNMDTSTITSFDKNHTYQFKVYGNLNANNSIFEYMTNSSPVEGGLQIYSDNVYIDNSYIANSILGVYIHHSSPAVVNSAIFGTEIYDVYLSNDSWPDLNSTSFEIDKFHYEDMTDTDNDTLHDAAEIYLWNTDPNDADPDNDSLNDYYEIANNTDPFHNDTDRDGLNDGEEINIYGTYPLSSDIDRDELTDPAELLAGTDFYDPDTDGDSLPDGWEITYGLDPLINTSDDGADGDIEPDGLTNLVEYKITTDPTISDTDYDTLTDDIEAIVTFRTNAIDAGADGHYDFIAGTWIAVDSNSTGTLEGYAYDSIYFHNITHNDTFDGTFITKSSGMNNVYVNGSFIYIDVLDNNAYDGFNEFAKYIPTSLPSGNLTSSPIPIFMAQGQEVIRDTDNDGMADVLDDDADNDKMPDLWEAQYGLNYLFDDSGDDTLDLDGLTNIKEYELGTDPTTNDTDTDEIPDGVEINASIDPLVDDALSDRDGDTRTNLIEYQTGTKINNPDSDDDGLTDGLEELWDFDTDGDNLINALDKDSDNDTLWDGHEYHVLKTNMTDPDTDHDNVEDNIELIYKTNPLDQDTDADFVRDDIEVYGPTDPLEPDSDEDDIIDGYEAAVNAYWIEAENIIDDNYQIRFEEDAKHYLSAVHENTIKKVINRDIVVGNGNYKVYVRARAGLIENDDFDDQNITEWITYTSGTSTITTDDQYSPSEFYNYGLYLDCTSGCNYAYTEKILDDNYLNNFLVSFDYMYVNTYDMSNFRVWSFETEGINITQYSTIIDVDDGSGPQQILDSTFLRWYHFDILFMNDKYFVYIDDKLIHEGYRTSKGISMFGPLGSVSNGDKGKAYWDNIKLTSGSRLNLTVGDDITTINDEFLLKDNYRWYQTDEFSIGSDNLTLQIYDTEFSSFDTMFVDQIFIQGEENFYHKQTNPMDQDTDGDNWTDSKEGVIDAYWFEAEHFIANGNLLENFFASNSKEVKSIAVSPIIEISTGHDYSNGTYQVYVKARADGSSSTISIDIDHDGTTDSENLDYSEMPEWKSMDSFDLTEDGEIDITIDYDSGAVIIDKILLIKGNFQKINMDIIIVGILRDYEYIGSTKVFFDEDQDDDGDGVGNYFETIISGTDPFDSSDGASLHLYIDLPPFEWIYPYDEYDEYRYLCPERAVPWENCPFWRHSISIDTPREGTDPLDPDTDTDNLDSGNEVHDIGSNPFDIDTDKDTLTDGWEIMHGWDPIDGDSDDDGILDSIENGDLNMGVTPDETDMFDDDTDNDGLIDGNEDTNMNGIEEAYETSSVWCDFDYDGMADGYDSDRDGISDGIEKGLTKPQGQDSYKISSNLGYFYSNSTQINLSVVQGWSRNFTPDADPFSITNPLDQDSDDDGLPDNVEDPDYDGYTNFTLNETNPGSFDTDRDGLSDGVELAIASATNPDTDLSVFIPDSDTNFNTDVLNPDTDGDRLLDGFEDSNHNGAREMDETNPLDIHSDGDDLDDGEEVLDYGSDPLSEDSDLDGLGDSDEVNLYRTNPASPDTDNDGIWDGYDITAGSEDHTGELSIGTKQLKADTDDDGLKDGKEIEGWTISVEDTAKNVTSHPLRKDTDADGLTDKEEYDLGTDPNLRDTDDDQMSDFYEVRIYKTDPRKADEDGDGLTDYIEIKLGTLSNNPDTDGDGISDGLEDGNHNGRIDSSETNPRSRDSDDDWLSDDVELQTHSPAYRIFFDAATSQESTGFTFTKDTSTAVDEDDKIFKTVASCPTSSKKCRFEIAGLESSGTYQVYVKMRGVNGIFNVGMTIWDWSWDNGGPTKLSSIGTTVSKEYRWYSSMLFVPNTDKITMFLTPNEPKGLYVEKLALVRLDGADYIAHSGQLMDPNDGDSDNDGRSDNAEVEKSGVYWFEAENMEIGPYHHADYPFVDPDPSNGRYVSSKNMWEQSFPEVYLAVRFRSREDSPYSIEYGESYNAWVRAKALRNGGDTEYDLSFDVRIFYDSTEEDIESTPIQVDNTIYWDWYYLGSFSVSSYANGVDFNVNAGKYLGIDKVLLVDTDYGDLSISEKACEVTDPLDWDMDGDNESDGNECLAEGAKIRTNPFDPLDGGQDSDKDGISDMVEEYVYFTDPNNEDTDGDGALDGYEVYVLGEEDPDHDGIKPVRDPDSDNDGLSDGEELEYYMGKNIETDPDGDNLLPPLDWDSDDDALLSIEGFEEALLKEEGWTEEDIELFKQESDLGDKYEVDNFMTGVANSDPDGDGVPPPLDKDSDDDGLIDTIDSHFYFVSLGSTDYTVEQFRIRYNSKISSSFGEGKHDLFELGFIETDLRTKGDWIIEEYSGSWVEVGRFEDFEAPYGDIYYTELRIQILDEDTFVPSIKVSVWNILTPDIDGDGLTDFEEIEKGTDMLDKDSDDDGLSDYDEVKNFYTDPRDQNSDDDLWPYDGYDPSPKQEQLIILDSGSSVTTERVYVKKPTVLFGVIVSPWEIVESGQIATKGSIGEFNAYFSNCLREHSEDVTCVPHPTKANVLFDGIVHGPKHTFDKCTTVKYSEEGKPAGCEEYTTTTIDSKAIRISVFNNKFVYKADDDDNMKFRVVVAPYDANDNNVINNDELSDFLEADVDLEIHFIYDSESDYEFDTCNAFISDFGGKIVKPGDVKISLGIPILDIGSIELSCSSQGKWEIEAEVGPFGIELLEGETTITKAECNCNDDLTKEIIAYTNSDNVHVGDGVSFNGYEYSFDMDYDKVANNNDADYLTMYLKGEVRWREDGVTYEKAEIDETMKILMTDIDKVPIPVVE